MLGSDRHWILEVCVCVCVFIFLSLPWQSYNCLYLAPVDLRFPAVPFSFAHSFLLSPSLLSSSSSLPPSLFLSLLSADLHCHYQLHFLAGKNQMQKHIQPLFFSFHFGFGHISLSFNDLLYNDLLYYMLNYFVRCYLGKIYKTTISTE